MTDFTATGTFIRRGEDFPLLVVSQDYELFFQRSGSLDKCLFKPCEMLLGFAEKRGIRITFFVDAGMLSRMQQLAGQFPVLQRDLSRVQQHIESIANRGHEIGLHIHPHWEDSRWHDGAWDFSGTRYKLDGFAADEVADIVHRYTGLLKDLCAGDVKSYRAGGFCIEPFGRIRDALLEEGITVDSSVVPGAVLQDDEKGFNFGAIADAPWWRFDESPLQEAGNGEFIEIPVTPQKLPFLHYWGRAADRLLKRQPPSVIGDGSSKAIGSREILRRLAGAGRVSELSIDAPKARQLHSAAILRQRRDVWQVMGHPKLLGAPSLRSLQQFIDDQRIRRFETVFELACAIRLTSEPTPQKGARQVPRFQ
jgi:hypothetical protein